MPIKQTTTLFPSNFYSAIVKTMHKSSYIPRFPLGRRRRQEQEENKGLTQSLLPAYDLCPIAEEIEDDLSWTKEHDSNKSGSPDATKNIVSVQSLSAIGPTGEARPLAWDEEINPTTTNLKMTTDIPNAEARGNDVHPRDDDNNTDKIRIAFEAAFCDVGANFPPFDTDINRNEKSKVNFDASFENFGEGLMEVRFPENATLGNCAAKRDKEKNLLRGGSTIVKPSQELQSGAVSCFTVSGNLQNTKTEGTSLFYKKDTPRRPVPDEECNTLKKVESNTRNDKDLLQLTSGSSSYKSKWNPSVVSSFAISSLLYVVEKCDSKIVIAGTFVVFAFVCANVHEAVRQGDK